MEKQINGKVYEFLPDENNEFADACDGCVFDDVNCSRINETDECIEVGGIWKLKE